VPLDVPPDLASIRSDDRFSVPERGAASGNTLSDFQRGAQQPAVARDPSQRALLPATPATVRLEKSGAQRWLVVSKPAEQVVPTLRQFWLDSGFTLAIDSPELGVLETDWAENRAKLPQDVIRRTVGRVLDGLYSTGERDRFRTRIERAGNATEIYVSHRGMIEVYTEELKNQTRWQPRPTNVELEAEFLRRIQLKLAGIDQTAGAGTPAAAGTAGAAAGATAQTETQPKARLVGEALEVDDAFDRAWRRIGLALDRAGFTVEDRDRAQGVFYVRYAEGERSVQSRPTGFFARLFSSEPKVPATQQYRVTVAGAGERSTVRVFDKDGQRSQAADERKAADRILALLRDELK
jgi:outer membrane protein assembly factor BamC